MTFTKITVLTNSHGHLKILAKECTGQGEGIDPHLFSSLYTVAMKAGMRSSMGYPSCQKVQEAIGDGAWTCCPSHVGKVPQRKPRLRHTGLTTLGVPCTPSVDVPFYFVLQNSVWTSGSSTPRIHCST